MLLEEVDAKAVKASSLNKLGTPASWSVYLRCGVGSRTILCLGSSARVNRGGTQHHLVSRASKVHQVYFSAAPGPSSGWRPGKLGGPEPHLSYLNPSSVVGSTKAPSLPLQCSPSLSGNSSSFPVPPPSPPKWHRSSAPLLPHESPGFLDLRRESGGGGGGVLRAVTHPAASPATRRGRAIPSLRVAEPRLGAPSPRPALLPRRASACGGNLRPPRATDRRRPLVRAPRPPGAGSPRCLTWHVDLAALLVREFAPVPLARGDAWLLHQERTGHLRSLLARCASLP